MSDGNLYQSRIDAAKRILVGLNLLNPFVRIANDEANKQRKKFYAKFKPQEITEAGRIIQSLTISSTLEDMAVLYDPSQVIHAVIRRWFDKVKGNSYFSCRVTVPLDEGKELALWFRFNMVMDRSRKEEIIETLFRLNIIKEKKDYFREDNITLDDQGYMRKNQNWLTGLYL